MKMKRIVKFWENHTIESEVRIFDPDHYFFFKLKVFQSYKYCINNDLALGVIHFFT